MALEFVTVTLTRSLTRDEAARLRASEVRDYPTGGEITVPYYDAVVLINGGYAVGVDPANLEEVTAFLAGDVVQGTIV